MRLKLTQNVNFNAHTDASRQRDVSNAPDAIARVDPSVNVPVNTVDSEFDPAIFSDEDEEADETEKKEADTR